MRKAIVAMAEIVTVGAAAIPTATSADRRGAWHTGRLRGPARGSMTTSMLTVPVLPITAVIDSAAFQRLTDGGGVGWGFADRVHPNWQKCE